MSHARARLEIVILRERPRSTSRLQVACDRGAPVRAPKAPARLCVDGPPRHAGDGDHRDRVWRDLSDLLCARARVLPDRLLVVRRAGAVQRIVAGVRANQHSERGRWRRKQCVERCAAAHAQRRPAAAARLRRGRLRQEQEAAGEPYGWVRGVGTPGPVACWVRGGS